MTRKIIVVLAFVTVMSALLATAVFAGGPICGHHTDSFPSGDERTSFFFDPTVTGGFFDLNTQTGTIVGGFAPGVSIGPRGELFISFTELLSDPSASPASRLKVSYSQSLPDKPSFFSIWAGATSNPPPSMFSLMCEGLLCPPGGSSVFELSLPGRCPDLTPFDP